MKLGDLIRIFSGGRRVEQGGEGDVANHPISPLALYRHMIKWEESFPVSSNLIVEESLRRAPLYVMGTRI